jgi:DNA-binding CsgD family transcriptional regulator/tetratricopeptide (TPR) repeat protein
VLVVEDVQWADEATLDVLRFLSPRMAGLAGVLVLTYRDDGADPRHPLAHLLGQASRVERLHRLPLRPLSLAAVERLGSNGPLDPVAVHRVSAGNPFFVTEILSAGGLQPIPPTIVDAVLARVHRLDGASRDALEQLAVIPSAVHRWLVDALLPGGMPAVEVAERYGLIVVEPHGQRFRHELIRQAVVDTLSGVRRIELNQRVLAALTSRPDVDLSRIMHHAAEAGDVDAIVKFGPAAAEEASRAESHREAATHLRLVLRHGNRFAPPRRAELLQRYAVACYTSGELPAAVTAQQDSVALHRALGDAPLLGAALRWLSRIQWVATGELSEATRTADEAIAVLDETDDVTLRAMAYSSRAQLEMLANRNESAMAIGTTAVALARQAAEPSILAHALNNLGVCQWRLHNVDGPRNLDEALRIAAAANEVEEVCRAHVNTATMLFDNLDFAGASRHIVAGLRAAEDGGHLTYAVHLYSELGYVRLAVGDWDGAVKAAEQALDGPPRTAASAYLVLGTVGIRRGTSGGPVDLARAYELAASMDPQQFCPAAAALAEAAYLRGDLRAIPEIVEPPYRIALQLGVEAMWAPLAYWLSRVDHGLRPLEPEAQGAPVHPYLLQAAGHWEAAADAWKSAGCPYHHAAALADSDDPQVLLDALAILDRMGAAPLAHIVRARLRTAGLDRVPRGPTHSTRANPAALTARQLEVARLLCDGSTNTEIARRLHLSRRTVDHHVAAIFSKIGTHNRREFIARAGELGLITPDPDSTS